MTENELRQRGAEAERLLNEPLLKEAIGAVEQSTLTDLLACRGAEPEDDRKRLALVNRLHVIAQLRAHLYGAIAQGKAAAQPRSWA